MPDAAGTPRRRGAFQVEMTMAMDIVAATTHAFNLIDNFQKSPATHQGDIEALLGAAREGSEPALDVLMNIVLGTGDLANHVRQALTTLYADPATSQHARQTLEKASFDLCECHAKLKGEAANSKPPLQQLMLAGKHAYDMNYTQKESEINERIPRLYPTLAHLADHDKPDDFLTAGRLVDAAELQVVTPDRFKHLSFHTTVLRLPERAEDAARDHSPGNIKEGIAQIRSKLSDGKPVAAMIYASGHYMVAVFEKGGDREQTCTVLDTKPGLQSTQPNQDTLRAICTQFDGMACNFIAENLQENLPNACAPLGMMFLQEFDAELAGRPSIETALGSASASPLIEDVLSAAQRTRAAVAMEDFVASLKQTQDATANAARVLTERIRLLEGAATRAYV
jgi:hypothetical protein